MTSDTRCSCVIKKAPTYDVYVEYPCSIHRRMMDELVERWSSAMKEFGFNASPGLSVKENLYDFGEWWAKRKASGN